MNILLVSKICPEAVSELSRNHSVISGWEAKQDDLMTLVEDAEVLVFRSGVTISAELMAAAPRLKLLIRAGSGLDNINLAYARERGLELQRIPEPGARAVAELAVGLMLTLARQILFADKEIRKGRWLKHDLQGFLLLNKTLGIVGCGNIGTMFGVMAAALGMNVIACVKNSVSERARLLAEMNIHLTDFESVLHQADFLSLHVPLDDSTRHMIDRKQLAMMKPGAYLLNLARGGVVNEEALCSELLSGQGLAGAALDVHSREGNGEISPLVNLNNVVLTPHIGATSVDTQREIGQRIVSMIAAIDESDTSIPTTPGRSDYGFQGKTA